MGTRDHRNWTKGYQEALVDIADKINEGGMEAAIEWIRDNGDAATRQHAEDLMLWVD